MSTWIFVLLQISILASAVVGGVFLTFSDFTMRALDRAAPAAGIEVMQIINREVFRYVFMALLLGMAALSPVLIGYAHFSLNGPASRLIIAGGAFYLAGVFAVTVLFNVPMNNHLDTLDLAGPEAASYWKTTYFPKWTLWNHVRAIASVATASCYLAATIRLVQAPQ